MSLRILLMTPLSCDDPTSISILGGLGRAYHEQGHEVIVADLLDKPRDGTARERTSWGEIRRLGGPVRSPLVFSIKAVARLLPLLKEVDFVHIHLIGDCNLLVMASWLAFELSGASTVVTFQDFSNPTLKPPGVLGRRVLRRLLARSRWVTALTHYTASDISHRLLMRSSAIEVVPNGFDPGERGNSDTGVSIGRPSVLCVARLAHYKGIDILLLAWKDVCETVKDVDLVLCGPDNASGHYQKLARLLGLSSRVKFTGKRNRNEVWALMRSSLFVAHPARHESFGMSVLEAMACGKAVLATRAGGPEEYIEDGRSGLLVPPRDVDALRDGLLRLLADAGLRERLGREARRAAEGLTWDRAAAAYLALMERGRTDTATS